MEKQCLIIMPIGDPEGYAQGHFNRVYQYILVPASRLAGFSPSRADDPAASDSPMDILRNIIESEMVVCDLSSKYPNALYAFAIRQSMNLPVTLIHDLKTKLSIEIQALSPLEYDDSLRIDTVQTEIETLTELLKQTFANKGERNNLLSRFDFGSTRTDSNSSAAAIRPDEVIHKEESSLPVISPIPDYVGSPITQQEELDKLKSGDFIFHINYGKGEIRGISKMAKGKVAKIQFESGAKLLVLAPSGIFRKING